MKKRTLTKEERAEEKLVRTLRRMKPAQLKALSHAVKKELEKQKPPEASVRNPRVMRVVTPTCIITSTDHGFIPGTKIRTGGLSVIPNPNGPKVIMTNGAPSGGSWPVPAGADPQSLAGTTLDPGMHDKLFEEFQRVKVPALEQRTRAYDVPANQQPPNTPLL